MYEMLNDEYVSIKSFALVISPYNIIASSHCTRQIVHKHVLHIDCFVTFIYVL